MTENRAKTATTNRHLPQRLGDFTTLTEALDYAAHGETGVNFYDRHGRLTTALPYADVCRESQHMARRMLSLELNRGDRVALIADTTPGFITAFFACQFAGLVPVPLPVVSGLGSRDQYIVQLRGLLEACGASVLASEPAALPLAYEATRELSLSFVGSFDELRSLANNEDTLKPSRPDELAYLQYTSGSTHFPRGAMITHRAVMANLQGIAGPSGLALRPVDRAVSWLPFYHDMGLVGFMFGPLVSQVSADYLGPRQFAMRPGQWLNLISQNRGTVSYSPPFGYELCVRRLKREDVMRYDLSSWRVAGVGAEPIRPEALDLFSEHLAPAGFDRRAFLPSYGLAETALAVSFAKRNVGLQTQTIDRSQLESDGRVVPVSVVSADTSDDPTSRLALTTMVNCGAVLPGHQLEVRDDAGHRLPERQVGRILVRGPSVMAGYFGDPQSSRRVLDRDGWLDTGDFGYLHSGDLFITGRRKDLIIVNGRNIWPEDIEHLVESQSEIRVRDSVAFIRPEGDEPRVVVQAECRLGEPGARTDLTERLRNLILGDFGIRCLVELVPPHTLPRTSSGKRSRAEARRQFLQQQSKQDDIAPSSALSRS